MSCRARMAITKWCNHDTIILLWLFIDFDFVSGWLPSSIESPAANRRTPVVVCGSKPINSPPPPPARSPSSSWFQSAWLRLSSMNREEDGINLNPTSGGPGWASLKVKDWASVETSLPPHFRDLILKTLILETSRILHYFTSLFHFTNTSLILETSY